MEPTFSAFAGIPPPRFFTFGPSFIFAMLSLLSSPDAS